tara:strand:- start:81 stop:275 length:195 start_codon:yes stop_codon:yes gene_type:complete
MADEGNPKPKKPFIRPDIKKVKIKKIIIKKLKFEVISFNKFIFKPKTSLKSLNFFILVINKMMI